MSRLNDLKTNPEHYFWRSRNQKWWKTSTQRNLDSATIDIVDLCSSQKIEIDEVYAEYFGYNIPYIDHILYTSVSQNFDSFYIPACVYISDVESVLNNIEIRTPLAIDDKNQLNQIVSLVDINTPTTIWGNVGGINFNSHHEIVSSSSVRGLAVGKNTVFVKSSVKFSGGHDCKLNRDFNEANRSCICKDILDIYKSNFGVLETCINCESIKEINSEAIKYS